MCLDQVVRLIDQRPISAPVSASRAATRSPSSSTSSCVSDMRIASWGDRAPEASSAPSTQVRLHCGGVEPQIIQSVASELIENQRRTDSYRFEANPTATLSSASRYTRQRGLDVRSDASARVPHGHRECSRARVAQVHA